MVNDFFVHLAEHPTVGGSGYSRTSRLSGPLQGTALVAELRMTGTSLSRGERYALDEAARRVCRYKGVSEGYTRRVGSQLEPCWILLLDSMGVSRMDGASESFALAKNRSPKRSRPASLPKADALRICKKWGWDRIDVAAACKRLTRIGLRRHL